MSYPIIGTQAVAGQGALGVIGGGSGTAVTRETLGLATTDIVQFLALILSGQSLTGSQATSLLDLATTWSTSGTPTALKLNVTDTASNAASLLLALQVGGSSRFSINKGDANGGYLRFATTGSGPQLLTSNNSGGFMVTRQDSTGSYLDLFARNFIGVSTGSIGFWSGTSFGSGSQDVLLLRDAANTLAQRNGTNAQTFRLYNTYTDASNYERGVMAWNSNRLDIGPQAAGTGTLRSIGLLSHVLFPTDNTYDIGASGATRPRNVFIAGYVRFGSYTVATVPSASTAGAGAQIYVSDESGGAVPAFSDGTNWRRVTDRAVVS